MGFDENGLRCFSTLRGDKIGFGESSRPVGTPKEKLSYSPKVRRRIGKRPKPAGGFGKQTVLRLWRRLLRRVFIASNHRADSDQTAGLPTSFFSHFFFLVKKKWERSSFPKGKIYKSPVGRQIKAFAKTLFAKAPSADKNLSFSLEKKPDPCYNIFNLIF